MNTNLSGKSIVCFGEILWDNLPSGRKPGGAPMNVAYHLHKLNINTHLISSVGNDDAGFELVKFLKNMHVPVSYIQVDPHHNTSEVIATINDDHEVSYDIVTDVSWDYIQHSIENEKIVRESDAFVFGSLSSRNIASRTTLFKLLEQASYRVFDVNLRAPYYNPELICGLLSHADIVKVNSSELQLIAAWNNCSAERELDTVERLFERFNIKEMLITKGSQGATYYNSLLTYEYPAYRITVNDTIGSGDSFLAAFLAMKTSDAPLEVILDYAVAMGAFITSQSGACPEYSKFDLDKFIWKRKVGLEKAKDRSHLPHHHN